MLQFLFYLLCSCSVFVLFLFVLFSYFVSICIVHVLFSFCFQFQLHFIYSIYIYIFKYTYMCIYICMPCSLYKYFQFNNCYFFSKKHLRQRYRSIRSHFAFQVRCCSLQELFECV